MNYLSALLNTELKLLFLIAIGIFFKKVKLITSELKKGATDLVINIILPFNIISSFVSGINMSSQLLTNCLLALLVGSIVEVFVVLLSPIVFGKFTDDQRRVMTYGMICPNSSFIGIPMAEAVFGSIGVMYVCIAQTPIRLVMWSIGLGQFTTKGQSSEDKEQMKDLMKQAILKTIKHPCIIALVIGIILMLLPIKLPTFALDTINSIGKCTVPVSMIIVGAILADVKPNSIMSKPVVVFTLFRLIITPLAILIPMYLLKADAALTGSLVILFGLSAGGTMPILAEKYDTDAEVASKALLITTALAMLTLPGLVVLMSYLFNFS